ncbi:uncharacterized protein CCR75_007856 [Bremia lactucae]|uniref:Uncharacterized protein n=1 Tax=Bremia lactucae TaxID=4779 RepID=A0A976FM44_BRELC|nr:hypothetical protein CCR75_007967 [Bremia lactucae]TDH69081.1 hypothetical protein CCR75_009103 [Bremia lactucae]TDH72481.1 hypothetical protein CCR75_007856 [Bremia lactucae]
MGLEDASTLSAPVDDDPPKPTDFLTYWTKSTASSIDRFYVPRGWASLVQWVEVIEPAVESDHLRVSLILGRGALNAPESRRNPLLSELIDRNVGRDPSALTRDDQALWCIAAIKWCASVQNNEANGMWKRFSGKREQV